MQFAKILHQDTIACVLKVMLRNLTQKLHANRFGVEKSVIFRNT